MIYFFARSRGDDGVIRLTPADFSGTCSTVQVLRAGQLLVSRITGPVLLVRSTCQIQAIIRHNRGSVESSYEIGSFCG
jgi:hypothetical protein